MAGEQDDTGTGMGPDEARNLAAIAASIADEPKPDAAQPTGEPELIQPEPNEADDVDSLAGIIELIFSPADAFGMHRTAAIWTPEACRKVAEKAVPVLYKSGAGRAFLAWCREGFGVEELALLAVLFPLAKRTFQAVKADIADLKAQPAQPAQPAAASADQ
jgi:hypothetical protein